MTFLDFDGYHLEAIVIYLGMLTGLWEVFLHNVLVGTFKVSMGYSASSVNVYSMCFLHLDTNVNNLG